MTEPDIELSHVSRLFVGPPPVEALRDATLRVFPGEYLAIMGRSGSGKSTLLNIMGLLDRPSRGEHILKHRSVSSLSEGERDEMRARHIGFMFQTSHLINTRSVLDNVRTLA